MFKPTTSQFLATLFMAVLTVAFTATAFGQTDPPSVTSANPHDFSDKYYSSNGVNAKEINGRLTGSDFLSTITETDDPTYSNVRVLITLPAYMQDGRPVFWSPLGVLANNEAGADTGGISDVAMRYPIYVFPAISVSNQSQFFTRTRQAPLMNNSADLSAEGNPLGVRHILTVNYNANAGTRWGMRILRVMAKENGTALDGGPVVKTMDDLKTLIDYNLVTITSGSNGDAFAICPVIQDNKNGAIAKDAFLSTATTNDGKPLDAERVFVSMFACAQDESQCSMN